VGRLEERATVEQLLVRAHAGQSGALVVRGEAGIGKTALLEYVRESATTSGFRTEAAAGVESETQFVFAGLHQLCAPLLDLVGALPEPQQTALGVAFGMHVGAGPAADQERPAYLSCRTCSSTVLTPVADTCDRLT